MVPALTVAGVILLAVGAAVLAWRHPGAETPLTAAAAVIGSVGQPALVAARARSRP